MKSDCRVPAGNWVRRAGLVCQRQGGFGLQQLPEDPRGFNKVYGLSVGAWSWPKGPGFEGGALCFSGPGL